MELTEVTGKNWKQAVFLTTDPNGRFLWTKWIISNAFSLLQARYDPNWDCRLLVDGGNPCGALLSTATGRSRTGIFCAGT